MAEEEEGLSAEQMDALLKDLESRASGGSSKPAAAANETEDEDVEAFLRQLENEDYQAPAQVAEREPDPLEAQFAGLEEPPNAELQKAKSSEVDAPDEKSKKEKKEKKKKASDIKVVERGESRGLKILLGTLKWSAVVVPALALWWVLGAFLAQWVSASWLVATLATAVLFLVPFFARMAVRRGRYRWWLSGIATAGLVGLIAPMPDTAADSLSKYGHWPATTVAAAAGWDADHFLVGTNAFMAEFVAGQLSGAELESARQLGTDRPIGEAAATEQPSPVNDDAPPANP